MKPDQELTLATFGVENDKEVWPDLENLHPQQRKEKMESTTEVKRVSETKPISASGSEIVKKSEMSSDTILRLLALNTKAYGHYMHVQGILMKALDKVNQPQEQNQNQAQGQNQAQD